MAAGDYPVDELDATWKKVLLNQFHDILPGSSIDWVYEEAERDLSDVAFNAARVVARAIKKVAGDGYRAARVQRQLASAAGGDRVRPSAEVGRSAAMRLGRPGGAVGPRRAARSGLRPRHGEQPVARASGTTAVCLTSIWDKHSAARGAAAAPATCCSSTTTTRSRWDAWDLDLEYLDTVTELTDLAEQGIEESGGLRGAVRFTREFGHSRLTSAWSSMRTLACFALSARWTGARCTSC